MSWNGWLMSKPVGMGDISTAVGYSSLDLGTLIAKGSIKKWALHKPVKLISAYDTPIDIYPDDATWLNYMQTKVAEAESNTLAPYGLKVGTSANIYKIIGETADAAVDWVYQQPPITGTFWRRMLDFKGYTNTPNVPINPISDFTYYDDSVNVLTIDTNEGEAGSTSIQVSQLTQLNSYNLMLAIKMNSSYWKVVVMDTTISNSLVQGTTYIDFTLPGTLGLSPSSSGYDAYLVGVATSADMVKNTWIQQSDSAMQNFYTMLPLPLPSKTDCKFKFKVQAVAPTNIVYLSYTLYLKSSDYTIQRIEFYGYKYGQTVNGFTFTITNIVVHDDNETQTWPLSNTVIRLDPFTYDSNTRQSSASKTTDITSYNIKAGDYPNITYSTTNSGNYTVNDGGGSVVYVD